MRLDTYTEHNPLNPINQTELPEIELTELEAQQEWNMELCAKIAKYKKVIAECVEILEQTENTLVLNKLKPYL